MESDSLAAPVQLDTAQSSHDCRHTTVRIDRVDKFVELRCETSWLVILTLSLRFSFLALSDKARFTYKGRWTTSNKTIDREQSDLSSKKTVPHKYLHSLRTKDDLVEYRGSIQHDSDSSNQ